MLEIAHTHFCTRDDGSNGSTPRTSIKTIQDSLSSFESMKSVAGNALAQINKQMITQKSSDKSNHSSPSRGKVFFLTESWPQIQLCK